MNVPLFPTNFYFGSILAAIIDPALAAPTVLAAAKVILGQDAISPGLGTDYASLNECDFTGYARGATIVWGDAINDVDTTPTSISPAYLFRASGGAVANQVQNVASRVTKAVAARMVRRVDGGEVVQWTEQLWLDPAGVRVGDAHQGRVVPWGTIEGVKDGSQSGRIEIYARAFGEGCRSNE